MTTEAVIERAYDDLTHPDSTAAALATLGSDWVVLHDVRWPDRPDTAIDYVAVGPGGVFAIDTQDWTGKLTAKNGSLKHGRDRRDDAVDRIEAAARVVSVLTGARTFPIICVPGTVNMDGDIDRVNIMSVEDLAWSLSMHSLALGPRGREGVLERLRASFIPESQSRGSGSLYELAEARQADLEVPEEWQVALDAADAEPEAIEPEPIEQELLEPELVEPEVLDDAELAPVHELYAEPTYPDFALEIEEPIERSRFAELRRLALPADDYEDDTIDIPAIEVEAVEPAMPVILTGPGKRRAQPVSRAELRARRKANGSAKARHADNGHTVRLATVGVLGAGACVAIAEYGHTFISRLV